MKTFKEYIEEAFDRPAKWRWLDRPLEMNYGVTAKFETKGVKYHVIFGRIDDDREEWEVEFYPANKTDSDKISSLEVITTVMDIIKDFLKTAEPEILTFSGSKPMRGGGDKLDRGGLYKKLVKKYVPRGEYDVSISDIGSYIHFDIKRKK